MGYHGVHWDLGPPTDVTLQRHGADAGRNFEAIDRWLSYELGKPSESMEKSEMTIGVEYQPRPFGSRPYRKWQLSWGEVALYYEQRDGEAELEIAWSR